MFILTLLLLGGIIGWNQHRKRKQLHEFISWNRAILSERGFSEYCTEVEMNKTTSKVCLYLPSKYWIKTSNFGELIIVLKTLESDVYIEFLLLRWQERGEINSFEEYVKESREEAFRDVPQEGLVKVKEDAIDGLVSCIDYRVKLKNVLGEGDVLYTGNCAYNYGRNGVYSINYIGLSGAHKEELPLMIRTLLIK